MKKKHSIAILLATVAVILCLSAFGLVWGANILLTNLIDEINMVCVDQKFSTVEEAIQALEAVERDEYDGGLDCCPPYNAVYSFDYDKNTIVFFSYCYTLDGKESDSYVVRILNHNDDGTLSFDSGFAYFYKVEPNGNENYYEFTNIDTDNGTQSISFFYLNKDSDKDIYVDGNKAEKKLVSIENNAFYICYAISEGDTFLSNICKRHKVEIK